MPWNTITQSTWHTFGITNRTLHQNFRNSYSKIYKTMYNNSISNTCYNTTNNYNPTLPHESVHQHPAYIKRQDQYSTFKHSSNFTYASKYTSSGGKPYIPKRMMTLESCRHVLGGQGALRSYQTEH